MRQVSTSTTVLLSLLLKLFEHLLLLRDSRASLQTVSMLLCCATGRWHLPRCWDDSLTLVSHMADVGARIFWLVLLLEPVL